MSDHFPPPPSTEQLREIYARSRRVAVVGASATGGKAANEIPRYLQSQGYRIIPVNPRGGEILGEHAYPGLPAVDLPVDVVDVFRPPQDAEAVARDRSRSARPCCGSSRARTPRPPSVWPAMPG